MAYVHMFYGDYRAGDNAWTFLRQFEEDLAELSQLSKTEKCHRFYNYCRSGSKAEYWYEELKHISPIVLTSWFTLANHFHVKWLCGSPNLLLESPEIKQITITQSNTATTVSRKTTTTTAMDSIDATATDELQDSEGSARGREGTGETQNTGDGAEKEEDKTKTISPITSETAPCGNVTRFSAPTTASNFNGASPSMSECRCPASPMKSSTNGCSNRLSKPLSPLASPKPAPPLLGAPVTPPQTVHAPPKPIVTPSNNDVAAHAHTPTMDALSNCNPAASVPINPVPVDPDPGDVAPNPARLSLTNTAPALINPDLITILPAFMSAVPVDPDLVHATLANTVPADNVLIEPTCTGPDTLNSHIGDVFTACATVDTVPIDSVSIDPNPVTSVSLFINLLATGSTPTHITLADLFNSAFVGSIYSTPTNPVHVDPVSPDIVNLTAFAITTLVLTAFFSHYFHWLDSNLHICILEIFSFGHLKEGGHFGHW
jgi:hypothetical protein